MVTDHLIHSFKLKRNIVLSFVILLSLVLLVAQISYHRGFTRGSLEWREVKGRSFAQEQKTKQCQSLLAQASKQVSDFHIELEQSAKVTELLKQEIKNLSTLNANFAQENTLYKKILAPEYQQKGIQINSVQIYPLQSPGKYRYEVLLAKFTHQKQESLGSMQLSVQGVQDDELIQIPPEALTREWPAGQPFKVRYFQLLQGQISLPEGFTPESIQVSLVPEGDQDKVTSEDFPWLVSIG